MVIESLLLELMTNYIKENDIRALIALVLKAIYKAEGKEWNGE